MATSIDDNAADENLYKLFGEMSVIQYTSVVTRLYLVLLLTYSEAVVNLG